MAESDPAVIVARVLDALEAGEDEAIADDVSAQVRSILPGITTGVLRGSTAAANPYECGNLLTDGEICGTFRFQLSRLRLGHAQFARVAPRAPARLS